MNKRHRNRLYTPVTICKAFGNEWGGVLGFSPPFLSFSSYPQGKSDAKRQIMAIWVQTQNENTCDVSKKLCDENKKHRQREEVYMVAVFQAHIRVLRKTGSKWDNKNLNEHKLRLTASQSWANTNKPQHTLSASRLLPSMDRRLHVMGGSRSHRDAAAVRVQ